MNKYMVEYREYNISSSKNDEFGTIGTVIIANEPWFVGKDVAEILGYSNVRKAQ